MVDTKLLAGIPLFRGLSTVELEEIASHLTERKGVPQECIIKEGDPPGHPIFVLMRGAVEVLKGGVDGREHVISSLAAPSVFGEIEVLAKRPAIASVVATTNVELAMLKRGVFDEMAQQDRTAVLKIIKNLAQTLSYRLAATDERLASYFDVGDTTMRERLGLVRTVLYSSWKAD